MILEFIILFLVIFIIIFYVLINKKTDLELARYYHNQSNGEKALQYYFKCLQNGNKLVSIDIANIYNYGLADTDINLFKAFQYNYILLQSLYNYNDPLSKKYKLSSLNKMNNIKQLLLEQNKPPEVKPKSSDVNIDSYLLNNIFHDFDKNNLFCNQNIRRPIVELYVPTVIHIIDNINNANILNNIDNYNLYDHQLYNHNNIDNQNVHDSYVNNTVSNSIKNLKSNNIDNIKLNYNDIESIITNNLNNKNDPRKNNILRVINKINISTFVSSKDKLSLKEVLVLVFNNIYNKDSQIDIKDTFLNNLFNELNDCIEHERVVCDTGIYNRIVNSINLLDPDVNIKSYDSLNDEIMNKCIAIRNNLSEDELDNDDLFKNKIRSEMKLDYVDSNILSQEQLNDILNIWIDHI